MKEEYEDSSSSSLGFTIVRLVFVLVCCLGLGFLKMGLGFVILGLGFLCIKGSEKVLIIHMNTG